LAEVIQKDALNCAYVQQPLCFSICAVNETVYYGMVRPLRS